MTNSNLSSFTCDACGKTVMHDPSKAHVPSGWRMRLIEGNPYLLCEAHSIDGHFYPTLSPSIKELFAAKGIHFKEDT